MRNWNENAALRGAWRRIFARSPIVREVLAEGKRYVPRYNQDGSRGKKDAVEYHCQVCDTWVPARLNKKNNIAVDHIVPVISTENTSGLVEDWNEYKVRLFCDKSNLQRVCRACHQKKTNEERMQRNTLKYTAELDILEKKWHDGELILKDYLKTLKKYKSKTRPQAIRDRADKMIEVAK